MGAARSTHDPNQSYRKPSSTEPKLVLPRSLSSQSLSECGRRRMSLNSKSSAISLNAVQWQPNEYERRLLHRTWSDDFEFLYDVGTSIYGYVFERSPDAQQLFPSLAAAGENWRESAAFKKQALKFVQVISHAVNHLSQPHRLDPMLISVGKAHRRFSARGFRADHWAIFQEAIQAALKKHIDKREEWDDSEKAEVINQWNLLAAYIVQKMYVGFVESNESVKKKSSATLRSPGLPSSTPASPKVSLAYQ